MAVSDDERPAPRVVIGPAGPEPGELHAYFRQVEEQFIGLRGAPFLLTPKDWKVIASWHERRIPLDLVASALRAVFEGRRERGETGRVSSIRYCAPAVEKAWKEARDLLLSAAVAEAPAANEVTESWRERLEKVAAGIPTEVPEATVWRQRVVALSRSPSEEAAREGLREIEDGLLRELERALRPEEKAGLEERLTRALDGVRGRVEAKDLPTVRSALRRRLLRETVEMEPLRIE